MSTHLLPIYIKNAEYNIAKKSRRFETREMSFGESLEFCSHFRVCAISWLLLAFDVERFSRFLHMAASSFRFFVEGTPAANQVTSHAVPFFDAVASGDLACASAISRSSRATWNPDYEYEEDFLYMISVMELAFPGAVTGEADGLSARWAALIGGQEDERLRACKSLGDGDSERFHDALSELLSQQKEKIDRLARSDRILPEIAATGGHVSVEGLALLRLAEARGLAVEDEYLMVPSVIRNINMADADPDDWRNWG